ncbi:MAG: hypothetical protein LBI11_00635 [Streptococcaceae bacterium]|jgi:hypothetical protein|nr:hypothetical protein [Streptococcaceae bacterium]
MMGGNWGGNYGNSGSCNGISGGASQAGWFFDGVGLLVFVIGVGLLIWLLVRHAQKPVSADRNVSGFTTHELTAEMDKRNAQHSLESEVAALRSELADLKQSNDWEKKNENDQ